MTRAKYLCAPKNDKPSLPTDHMVSNNIRISTILKSSHVGTKTEFQTICVNRQTGRLSCGSLCIVVVPSIKSSTLKDISYDVETKYIVLVDIDSINMRSGNIFKLDSGDEIVSVSYDESITTYEFIFNDLIFTDLTFTLSIPNIDDNEVMIYKPPFISKYKLLASNMIKSQNEITMSITVESKYTYIPSYQLCLQIDDVTKIGVLNNNIYTFFITPNPTNDITYTLTLELHDDDVDTNVVLDSVTITPVYVPLEEGTVDSNVLIDNVFNAIDYYYNGDITLTKFNSDRKLLIGKSDDNLISDWDISNISFLIAVFDGSAQSVHSANVRTYLSSSFNTSLNWNPLVAINMLDMFRGCTKFDGLSGVKTWDVVESAHTENMFQYTAVNDPNVDSETGTPNNVMYFAETHVL
jgi:hypothetical protein